MRLSTFFTFGLYKPFTHDPQDFKLRFIESWFSEKYVILQYTANGGENWKSIKCAQEPSLDGDNWYLDVETYPLNSSEEYFKEIKEKFPTYQSVIDFENKQKEKVKRKNQELKEEEIKNQKKKIKKLQKINSL